MLDGEQGTVVGKMRVQASWGIYLTTSRPMQLMGHIFAPKLIMLYKGHEAALSKRRAVETKDEVAEVAHCKGPRLTFSQPGVCTSHPIATHRMKATPEHATDIRGADLHRARPVQRVMSSHDKCSYSHMLSYARYSIVCRQQGDEGGFEGSGLRRIRT